MAFIKLPTVTDAMLTLMRMHNHKMMGRYLRVSFSSKDAQAFDASANNSSSSSSHANAASSSSASAGAGSSSSSFNGQPSMPATSSSNAANGSGAQDEDTGME